VGVVVWVRPLGSVQRVVPLPRDLKRAEATLVVVGDRALCRDRHHRGPMGASFCGVGRHRGPLGAIYDAKGTQ
jgi:hypothetical protein